MGKTTSIFWMIWDIDNSQYEHTIYCWQRKTFIDRNFWEVRWRMLDCKKEFIWVQVKTRDCNCCVLIPVLVRSFNCCAEQVTIRMLIGDCGKNNTTSTRYLFDFPELSHHLQLTVPVTERWCPLLPMVATCWFENFLISPTNMFHRLHMWTSAYCHIPLSNNLFHNETYFLIYIVHQH